MKIAKTIIARLLIVPATILVAFLIVPAAALAIIALPFYVIYQAGVALIGGRDGYRPYRYRDPFND